MKNYLLISFYVFRDCLLNYTKEKSDLLSLENKIEKVSIAESYLSTKLCWWSFFLITNESKSSISDCLMVVYEQHSLPVRRGQQRWLNYVPDANIVDCSVPLASSIHLSASLKIPLMRYGICIRSHFEYEALSSQARSVLVSLSLSLFFSRLVESRLRAFPSFLSCTSRRRSIFSYGTSRIYRRSAIESRSVIGENLHDRGTLLETIAHDFSPNKRACTYRLDRLIRYYIALNYYIRYNYYIL